MALSTGQPGTQLVAGLLYWTPSTMHRTTICPQWKRHSFYFIFVLFINFYWSRVGLQCCSFLAVQQSDAVVRIYISTLFFLNFSSLYFYLFIYLWRLLGLRFCARAFSNCGKRGPLFIAVRGPLTIAASLVAEHRLQTRRLSNCGPAAPRHVGSSQTRARTRVPCIGRQTLNHCATREAPVHSFLDFLPI